MATADNIKICNRGLYDIGAGRITSLATTTPKGRKLDDIFEDVVNELLEDEWNFNSDRAQLTEVRKLTVDTAPSAANFVRDATITGATSGVTCTVVKVVSSTVYWVTEPSGDFTDGEVLSDGTNSVDCAADYPEVSDQGDVLDFGKWDYVYKLPDDYLYTDGNNDGLVDEQHDNVKYRYKIEGQCLLTNQDEAYLLYHTTLNDADGNVDVTLMRGWFKNLISAKIAYILCNSITENMRFRQKAEVQLNFAYLNAKDKNGEETHHPHSEGNYDWRDGARNYMSRE